jgi:hypothetical protein
MSANRYTASATIKAVTQIFRENRGKSFEARWVLAKKSDSFQGFQTRCRVTAIVLLAAAIPLLLAAMVVSRSAISDEYTLVYLFIVILYVSLSVTLSWRLGNKAVEKKMAKSVADGQRPM